MNRLSLSDALASNRLEDFIIQAEAQAIGPADRAQFEKVAGRVIAPRQAGQTSHLPAGDCSHGNSGDTILHTNSGDTTRILGRILGTQYWRILGTRILGTQY